MNTPIFFAKSAGLLWEEDIIHENPPHKVVGSVIIINDDAQHSNYIYD